MSDDPNAWMISGRWKTAPKGVVQERQRVADEGVPVEILRLAYAEYARQYGTSQSFEEIQRRAGFSVGEVIMLLADALGRGEQAGFERGVAWAASQNADSQAKMIASFDAMESRYHDAEAFNLQRLQSATEAGEAIGFERGVQAGKAEHSVMWNHGYKQGVEAERAKLPKIRNESFQRGVQAERARWVAKVEENTMWWAIDLIDEMEVTDG